ncbi:hypothetical protein ACLB2K_045703 [Fragaria x ananassa]
MEREMRQRYRETFELRFSFIEAHHLQSHIHDCDAERKLCPPVRRHEKGPSRFGGQVFRGGGRVFRSLRRSLIGEDRRRSWSRPALFGTGFTKRRNLLQSPCSHHLQVEGCEACQIYLDSSGFKTLKLIFDDDKIIRKGRPYSSSMASAPEENPNTFSVESKLLPSNCIPTFSNSALNSTKFLVQFLAIKNGKAEIGGYGLSCLGNIRATCNGLILLDNKVKKGGLIVLNPVTRKLIALPLGTLQPPYNESYGFALSDVTGEYKIVHLFRDELGFVSCEILSLRKKAWREVNGPAFGLFGWFGYEPVSAIGALHWIPQVDQSDYIVSVEVHKERFHQIPLPKSCRTHDRIIEMGGALGFVTHEDINRIDIWILKGFCGEIWTKNHSITVGSVIDMIPYFSLRIKGDIIFKRDEEGTLYSYDFQQQDLSKVEMVKGCMPTSCLPHVNSLVSWIDESSDLHD